MNSIRRTFCTTREAAELLGISLRTAQLWAESGLLEAWKTEGGHRRINRESVQRLLASPALHADQHGAKQTTGAITADSPFKILIVEDKEDLQKLYEFNLRLWPLKPRVTVAENGFQALIKLGVEKPDLLIADLFMPDFDGFSMLKAIRGVHEFDDLAIVVVTGLSADDVSARGGVPAGIPVFPKPIPFGELQRFAGELASKKRLSP